MLHFVFKDDKPNPQDAQVDGSSKEKEDLEMKRKETERFYTTIQRGNIETGRGHSERQ